MAVAIYNSLTGANAQRAAVRSAAETALAGDDDLPLFLAMLDEATSLAKRRKPPAHDMWGSSPHVPKALLCVKAEHQLQRRSATVPEWLQMSTADEIQLPQRRSETSNSVRIAK